MGYQESYFTSVKYVRGNTYTSDTTHFNEFVSTIRNNGKEAYYEIGCTPVEIITLTKATEDYLGHKWTAGTKFIYFCGERFPQSCSDGWTANALLHPECIGCEHFRGKKCEGGECGPWNCKNKECNHIYDHGQVIIFTEEMPAESIWEDAGGRVTAIHESFWKE